MTKTTKTIAGARTTIPTTINKGKTARSKRCGSLPAGMFWDGIERIHESISFCFEYAGPIKRTRATMHHWESVRIGRSLRCRIQPYTTKMRYNQKVTPLPYIAPVFPYLYPSPPIFVFYFEQPPLRPPMPRRPPWGDEELGSQRWLVKKEERVANENC
ncbi:hypothetical protein F5Y19DRAFT_457637 [Xylariaceae sp. FL1651]|nr:hypothetical protein F5Y19DRAFT_457637 [Xylariaceae sp. FL1651]